MKKKYILDGKKVVECHDMRTWCQWFQIADRQVFKDKIGDSVISTVFLATDHGSDGSVVLFVTSVFGGPLDQTMDRCSTYEEAEAMHKRMVEKVKENFYE